MEPAFASNTLWNLSHDAQQLANTTQPNASTLGPNGDPVPLRWLALVAMLLVDALAVVGNLAVMATIAKTPHLRKFVFVFHLCMVDLLAASVLMPLGMVAARGLMPDALCRGYLCLGVGFTCASILSISAINVERYYYVVHPLRHEVKMTLGLVVLVLVGIWVKAALMAAFPLLGWLWQGEGAGGAVGGGHVQRLQHCSLYRPNGAPQRLVFMVAFVLMYFLCPVLIILVVYCSMFKVARVAGMQPGPLPTWTDTLPRPRADSLSSGASTAGGSLGGARTTPNRSFSGGKAAVVLLAVGGQFLGCWLPYFSFHLYSVLAPSPSPLGGTSSWDSRASLEEAVAWVGYLCFASNPVVYGCLNRQIREELWSRLARALKQGGVGRQDEQLPSREASIQENFLQFLQGTGCNLEPRGGGAEEAPLAPAPPPVPACPLDGCHLPGQIREEMSEFIEQQHLHNDLHKPDNCFSIKHEL